MFLGRLSLGDKNQRTGEESRWGVSNFEVKQVKMSTKSDNNTRVLSVFGLLRWEFCLEAVGIIPSRYLSELTSINYYNHSFIHI